MWNKEWDIRIDLKRDITMFEIQNSDLVRFLSHSSSRIKEWLHSCAKHKLITLFHQHARYSFFNFFYNKREEFLILIRKYHCTGTYNFLTKWFYSKIILLEITSINNDILFCFKYRENACAWCCFYTVLMSLEPDLEEFQSKCTI